MKNVFCLLWFLILLSGCNSDTECTEKYQSRRNEVIRVKDHVKEIQMDEVLISNAAFLNVLDSCLIIADARSVDTLVHVFNKNDFRHLVSFGIFGEGPEEISNLGFPVIDKGKHHIHVPDWGKYKIFVYPLDSVLHCSSDFSPHKISIDSRQFPDLYVPVDDTLCIARVIAKVKGSPFQQSLAYWNIRTGEILKVLYSHPEIERKRASFAVSKEKDLIVEAYNHHDLLTICDFSGNLKYNVYGPHWDNRTSNRMYYYGDVCIYKDYILAEYSGRENFSDDWWPDSFLVFDLDGNYIKTLKVGYAIEDFCVDEENNRIIMCLWNGYQFAYLDLDGLL